MRGFAKWLIALACTCAPTTAYAQASITGVVKDASGAVLPGVTAEAASPVLIEKVRSVVTDGTGQYRIVDLLPGSYTVTFTLAGFSTVRREMIELTGSFTATINVEMRLGAQEETITVSGESPVVDVQNARTQQTISNEIINSLPVGGRGFQSLGILIPGVVTSAHDVGGIQNSFGNPPLTTHGSKEGEARVRLDGWATGSPSAPGGADRSTYLTDVGNSEEVVITTSGNMGEAEQGGPVINLVPRSGGNSVRGSFFASGANGAMQGSNYTQALQNTGLTAPSDLQKLWDTTGAFGGPIKQDRLWYFLTARYRGNRNLVAGMYYNKNANDPSAWTYEPDLSRRATDDTTWKTASIRPTWQASQRNKFTFYYDEQSVCVSCIGGGTATVSPEAMMNYFSLPQGMKHANWSSPVTNRLLLEAGVATLSIRWGNKKMPGKNYDLIRVTEQAGMIPGLTYRSSVESTHWNHSWQGRASASYITGAHNLKVGYHVSRFDTEDKTFPTSDYLTYRFNNGVPNLLTMSADPFNLIAHRWTTAAYTQEQWTIRKLTLQGALRYDRSTTYFPDQQLGPTRFVQIPLLFPQQNGVQFNDISPRVGAAYDLFGNGKTAFKATLAKYVQVQDGNAVIGTVLNPLSRLATSTTRSWADSNNNHVPDCDLLNPASNSECGPWANQNFGRNVYPTVYDPAITSGWGTVQSNWLFGASVQHELAPRISGTVSYFRHWYQNFIVTDNRAVGPSDFDPYSIVAPIDSRLPGGGGFVIEDLYDVSPTRFGQVNNFVTSASGFGKQIEYWNGIDASVNARLRSGLTLQGGFSTGRTVRDQCDVVPKIDNPSRRFCRTQTLFLTQVTGFAAYVVPRVDVQISGTFLSKDGPELAAIYNVPNSEVAPSLGRSLSGNTPNVAVNLIEPGTLYGDRLNQLDIRVAKLVRVGRMRTQLGVDLYNAFNVSFIPTYNQTFGPRWLTPTSLLPARFAKLSAQIDF